MCSIQLRPISASFLWLPCDPWTNAQVQTIYAIVSVMIENIEIDDVDNEAPLIVTLDENGHRFYHDYLY
jgi:hypothetical protein